MAVKILENFQPCRVRNLEIKIISAGEIDVSVGLPAPVEDPGLFSVLHNRSQLHIIQFRVSDIVLWLCRLLHTHGDT